MAARRKEQQRTLGKARSICPKKKRPQAHRRLEMSCDNPAGRRTHCMGTQSGTQIRRQQTRLSDCRAAPPAAARKGQWNGPYTTLSLDPNTGRDSLLTAAGTVASLRPPCETLIREFMHKLAACLGALLVFCAASARFVARFSYRAGWYVYNICLTAVSALLLPARLQCTGCHQQ